MGWISLNLRRAKKKIEEQTGWRPLTEGRTPRPVSLTVERPKETKPQGYNLTPTKPHQKLLSSKEKELLEKQIEIGQQFPQRYKWRVDENNGKKIIFNPRWTASKELNAVKERKGKASFIGKRTRTPIEFNDEIILSIPEDMDTGKEPTGHRLLSVVLIDSTEVKSPIFRLVDGERGIRKMIVPEGYDDFDTLDDMVYLDGEIILSPHFETTRKNGEPVEVTSKSLSGGDYAQLIRTTIGSINTNTLMMFWEVTHGKLDGPLEYFIEGNKTVTINQNEEGEIEVKKRGGPYYILLDRDDGGAKFDMSYFRFQQGVKLDVFVYPIPIITKVT